MSKSQIATGGVADSAITVAKTSGVGITMIDQFRLTATINQDTDPISSNLERVDDASFSGIGTGMTLSSGVYTFPSTGLYQVIVNAKFEIAQDLVAFLETKVSSNSGGAYDQVATAAGGDQSSSFSASTSSSIAFVNVTNASNFRVKFVTSGFASTDSRITGGTNENETSFSFIRLGDSQ
tara:strand:- start:324 stop:863 length:540 start_codon:yes stop_codon:yes gene_type:complete